MSLGAAHEDTPGVRRAWAWVGHLRAGGTTAWRDWATEGEARGRILPGAQQLELLRRLNEAGRPSADLTARVLDASAPGRGRPDLELVGVIDHAAFGPPPVDPADLPDDELIRVATSVLADDVVAAGLPRTRRRTPLQRPWRTRYRLVGDPWVADPVRAELIRRGRPPGGRGCVVLVVGRAVDAMVVDAWTHRSLTEGGPDWGDWLDSVTHQPGLPPRVDVLGHARRWSDRIGTPRVQVVLDPALLPGLTGTRKPLPAPLELSADATDLARRTAAVLGLLVVPSKREALLRDTLRPRLAADDGPPLVVPPEHAEWLRRRATRMRAQLLRAGYAVHGDPDALLPRDRPGVTAPADAGVLALALRLLLEGDRDGRGPQRDGGETA
ncbi:hypothetical protein [Nocardioides sp. LS1]|uniref:hypothetical protein n=1 Tax=Nocardioides sp. LS1 TaxID=1027620 RepID=UPI000F620601|nr:hypothetical protein [Nocardioides sp. LS1]GCD90086.1 hypothetical protein NLS1_20920 [Nocardioides sp. LS1]